MTDKALDELTALVDALCKLPRAVARTALLTRLAQLVDELDRLWRASNEVAAAIGSVEFMDPPDGGSVTLAEQVQRMRSALDECRSDDRWRRVLGSPEFTQLLRDFDSRHGLAALLSPSPQASGRCTCAHHGDHAGCDASCGCRVIELDPPAPSGEATTPATHGAPND